MNPFFLLRPFSRALVPLLVGGAPLVACTTGQTGGEVEGDGGRETADEFAASCEATATTPLASDEETSIGITVSDLIEMISGTHEATLSWGTRIPEGAAVVPEPGVSTVVIEIEPLAETASFVDLELVESDAGDAEPAIDEVGEACADEVRVEASVSIVTGNGAFDDTFEVVFRASGPEIVHGAVEIDLDQLEGSFSLEGPEGSEPVQTMLSLSFAFGTMSGTLSGIFQEEHGSATSASPVMYAKFPEDGCDFGSLISAESDLGSTILAAVESASDFEFTWAGGETTELSVDAALGTLCFEGGYGGSSSVNARASALVTTADGRIDGDWDLDLRANVFEGTVESIFVSYPGSYEPGLSASDFAASVGIVGVESDASDLGLQFEFSIELTDASVPTLSGSASGSLAILELLVPDCARPGYEPEVIEDPDGGSSSPGCEGIDATEIETASFQMGFATE